MTAMFHLLGFFPPREAVLCCTHTDLIRDGCLLCVDTQERCPCTTKCTDDTRPLSKVADTCVSAPLVSHSYTTVWDSCKKTKTKDTKEHW